MQIADQDYSDQREHPKDRDKAHWARLGNIAATSTNQTSGADDNGSRFQSWETLGGLVA